MPITKPEPNAKLVLYSDAGHAFLFQHLENFTAEVKDFLQDWGNSAPSRGAGGGMWRVGDLHGQDPQAPTLLIAPDLVAANQNQHGRRSRLPRRPDCVAVEEQRHRTSDRRSDRLLGDRLLGDRLAELR